MEIKKRVLIDRCKAFIKDVQDLEKELNRTKHHEDSLSFQFDKLDDRLISLWEDTKQYLVNKNKEKR